MLKPADQVAVDYLSYHMSWTAVGLFFVFASIAWTARRRFQRSPIVGFAAGLAFVVAGLLLGSHATGVRIASTIFTEGTIALGVSIVAASLLVDRVACKSSPSVTTAVDGDPLVRHLTNEIERSWSELERIKAGSMAEKHRELLVQRETDRLCQLIRVREDLADRRAIAADRA